MNRAGFLILWPWPLWLWGVQASAGGPSTNLPGVSTQNHDKDDHSDIVPGALFTYSLACFTLYWRV